LTLFRRWRCLRECVCAMLQWQSFQERSRHNPRPA
jgi:hypothetical protein